MFIVSGKLCGETTNEPKKKGGLKCYSEKPPNCITGKTKNITLNRRGLKHINELRDITTINYLILTS